MDRGPLTAGGRGAMLSGMTHTRSVILVGATVLALALAGVTAASASPDPANRGWSSPVGAQEQLADQPSEQARR